MRYSIALVAAAAAVNASPMPQGVTLAVAPNAFAPSACSSAYPGSFGIVVNNVTAADPPAAGSVATQTADGQPAAGSSQAITTISDGQPQAPTGAPASQISDGQPQAPTGAPISQISDGQPQAPTGVPISQISDGQPQAPTGQPISQISDGQPQAPTGKPASQKSDGQPQAPTSGAAQPRATDPPSSGSGTSGAAACATNSTLALTLNNGVLTDSKGRTGYIASNYQFQFDAPPQAGAIYTAGFTTCSNGSLALGGSTIFYQCRSGNFFNLYNTNWAPQCNPVTINAVQLENC